MGQTLGEGILYKVFVSVLRGRWEVGSACGEVNSLVKWFAWWN